jgi:hypothetical protein
MKRDLVHMMNSSRKRSPRFKMMWTCMIVTMNLNRSKIWTLLEVDEALSLHLLFSKDNKSGWLAKIVILAYFHRWRTRTDRLTTLKYKSNITKAVLHQMNQVMIKTQSKKKKLNRSNCSCHKSHNKSLKRPRPKIFLFKSMIKIWRKSMMKINQFRQSHYRTRILRPHMWKL